MKILIPPGLTNLALPGGSTLASDWAMARTCVESLVGLDEKGTGLIVPQLATGWQVSPDYKFITFNLRKGVKFHDGTDFNAQAAKYNLEAIIKSPIPNLKSVTSVDIIDDYTIRLNLAKYEPALFFSMTGGGSAIISPNALQKFGEDIRFNPVGTGPYKFVSYQRDVSLKFERFDGFWGGKPYLDGIQFLFIADPVTMIMSFKSGDGHVITYLATKDAYELEKVRADVFKVPSGGIGMVGDSKNTNSPFHDIRVRQAISYAIDTKTISNSLTYGYYPYMNQFAFEQYFAYNPKVVGYPYNPEKAKELLSQTGYAKGFDTSIMFPASTDGTRLFTAVQGYLSKVGINLKLEAVDRSKYMETRQKGWSNSLINFGVPGSPGYDPGTGLLNYISKKAPNFVSVDISDDYQALLEKAYVEIDTNKRVEMFQQISKMMIDQYCMFFPIYGAVIINCRTSQVHDLNIFTFSGHDWTPQKVWFK